MNLLKLSCAQLTDLQSALSAIGEAAGKLAQSGLPPEISLTVDGTVLRAPSVLAEYAGVDPVQIVDDATALADPVIKASTAAPVAPLVKAPIAAPPSPPNTTPGETPAARSGSAKDRRSTPPPPALERDIDDCGLLRGPWLPEEEQTLIDLHVSGMPWDKISGTLNRPKSAVMFRAHKVLKDRISEAKRRVESAASPSARSREPARPARGKPNPTEASPAPSGSGAPPADPELRPSMASVPSPAQVADSRVGSAAKPAPKLPVGVPEFSTGRGPDATKATTSTERMPPPPDTLSGEARTLWMSLNWLRPDPVFGSGADLDLVEGLAQGRKLGEIALDLGVDAVAAKARFEVLSGSIRTPRGDLRIDGQQALIKALRARAAAETGAAR